MSRPFNPKLFCISCGHAWEPDETVCPYCEFDPVNNLVDAKQQAQAENLWDLMQEHRR